MKTIWIIFRNAGADDQIEIAGPSPAGLIFIEREHAMDAVRGMDECWQVATAQINFNDSYSKSSLRAECERSAA